MSLRSYGKDDVPRLLLPAQVPPRFFPEEFKRLPCRSIVTFIPLEVAWVMEHDPRYMMFSLKGEPNFFNQLALRMRIISGIMERINRNRKGPWKSDRIQYLVRRFANRPQWGNFLRLEPARLYTGKSAVSPYCIPIILPQALIGIRRPGNDKERVVCEYRF